MKEEFNNQPPKIALSQSDFKRDPKTGLGTTYEEFQKALEVFGVLVPSVRDKDGMGSDIFSYLLKERIIIVAGQVETGMTTNIIAQLKFLQAQNPSEPIQMWINSPGGSVVDGLAIVDVMRTIKCPIHTVGNGMQASMGSILLAAGDARAMTPHSSLMIHQIMGGARGGTQHTDFVISEDFMARSHENLKSVYVEFTGLNHDFWDIVGERDTWLTAEHAKELGFIHQIASASKNGGPYQASAKREPSSRLAKYFAEAKNKYLENASKSELLRYVNNGNAEGGIYSRIRAEMLLKLAKYPEFWVKERRDEHRKALAAAKQAANDDKPAAAKRRSASNDPK